MGVALPYAIEYLLTLRSASGGRLVRQLAFQVYIPIFPANTSISLIIPTQEYCALVYVQGWSQSVISDAFHHILQQAGTRPISNILTTDWLAGKQAAFVPITEAEPANMYIVNRTNLNQYYACTVGYLCIQNEEDWNTCFAALRRMGTSAELEELAEESNRLLRIMAGKPQPPLGGS